LFTTLHYAGAMTSWKAAAFAVFSCALASCTSGPVGEDPSIEVASLQTLPPPAAGDYAMPPSVSLIRPLDKLKIEVFGVEELKRETAVDSDGTLDFPLIGSVQANGLTAGELATSIEDGLRGPYVRDPHVTVAVIDTPGQLITIGGEVKEPGRYPAVGSMTLLDAVATGGGANPTAKLSEVIVQRTVDGQRYIGIYNMKAIARGNYADPQIYPGDVIMVGDSPVRRALGYLVAASPLLTSAVILFDRTSN
jgi:polysaccharide export outer membrane protein